MLYFHLWCAQPLFVMCTLNPFDFKIALSRMTLIQVALHSPTFPLPLHNDTSRFIMALHNDKTDSQGDPRLFYSSSFTDEMQITKQQFNNIFKQQRHFWDVNIHFERCLIVSFRACTHVVIIPLILCSLSNQINVYLSHTQSYTQLFLCSRNNYQIQKHRT